MKENDSNTEPKEFRSWFQYEEDKHPAPTYDPADDPHEKMWREVEEMRAEAEADGEIVDEDWMNERFFELDRKYKNEPPPDCEIALRNYGSIKRQREFQRAAEYVADEFSRLPEVLKVVAFGSVASPLDIEIPRFREFRRYGISIRHECKDLDLAVWLSCIDKLRELQKARGQALNRLFEVENIGVAHHQVEVFVMEPETDHFLGNLCGYAKCPKGKPDCRVEGCGDVKHLQKHEDFNLDKNALSPDRTRILFER
ncbi:MAG TPA: hypothetical protein PLN69_10530 [bacterium]|nr:hypothetical protein [bacterium]